MSEFIIYISKSSAGLTLLLFVYILLMRKESNFAIRRIYLLSIIVASPLFQLLPSVLPSPLLFVEQSIEVMPIDMVGKWVDIVATKESGVEFTTILFAIWATVASLLLIRLLYALGTIIDMRVKSTLHHSCLGDCLIHRGKGSPFTFFNWIFISECDIDNNDVLIHERAHKRGLHSLDMLLAEVMVVVMWFNPFVWILRREVRDNLEYIADRDVITSGVDKRLYQHELLRLHCQKEKNIVATYFNQSQIKKRIIMMNKRGKSSLGWIKYATLPMLVVALAMTNVRATAVEGIHGDKVEVIDSGKVSKERSSADIYEQLHLKTNSLEANPLIIMDGEQMTKEQFEALDYDQVARMSVLKKDEAIKRYGDKGKNGVIIVGSKGK